MASCGSWPFRPVGVFLALIVCVGCSEWLGEVPTVAALPTLTASPAPSPTPAVAPVTSTSVPTPTETLTPTSTPAGTPTPPLGVTSTPAANETPIPGLTTGREPHIVYFAATPEEVSPDEPILLFWSSQNGTEAAIYRRDENGTPGRTWAVALEGSLTVTAEAIGRSEIYVLAVTNGITTVEREVRVKVTCPFTWFFAPGPEDSCPQNEPVVSLAVTQEFERGRMIWLAANDQIVVLFNDFPTSPNESNPAWLLVADPFIEGSPESDPSIQPPSGLFQPVRGFGEVWRNMSGVRDRLGWATSSEIPFMSVTQSGRVGEDEQLYLTNQLGEVIALIPDGQGWLVVAFIDQALTMPTLAPP